MRSKGLKMKFRDYDLPDDLKYNEDSAWVRIEGDLATLGVVEPVAKVLKEFLFAKLPEKGLIKKGDVWLSLEALKWSGHLKSPLSGEIIEVNSEVFDEPDRINKDPYGTWIVKIRLGDKNELNDLNSPSDILPWLEKIIK